MVLQNSVEVECDDGPCGEAKYVILDPTNAAVTHVVVDERAVPGETRLVPLSSVAESTPQYIRLQVTQNELEALPRFSELEYVAAEEPREADAAPELWMGALSAYAEGPLVGVVRLEPHRDVPAGELPIQRGARVVATDGLVGRVDEFLVDPGAGRITHLVLQRGHLWGRREVVIPVLTIDRVDEGTVYLQIDKERVGEFPQPGAENRPTILGNEGMMRTDSGEQAVPQKPGPVQTLVTDLGSSDWTKREHARLALAKKGASAVDALASALSNGSTQVRWEAAKSLQSIHSPAAAPALVAALEDSSFGVRWIAAESLAGLGRPGAIAVLRTLTHRADSVWLREGAHHVLNSVTNPALQRVVAPVVAALDGIEPALEAPVAAHEALAALRKAG